MSDTDTLATDTAAIVDPTDPRYLICEGRRLLRVRGGDGSDDAGADDAGDSDDDGGDAGVDKDDPDKGSDPAAEAAKWKALARKHEDQAKKNAGAAKKLAELEEGEKTDLQKATDKAAELEQRAADAERGLLQLETALDKAPEGLGVAQIRKLAKRLAGSSREEFEADAEELFADFVPDKGGEKDDDKDKKPRRPRERLTPGAAPEAEPEKNDPASLAADVPRGW